MISILSAPERSNTLASWASILDRLRPSTIPSTTIGEAIDFLLVYMEAGLPLAMAFKHVAEAITQKQPTLAMHMSLAAAQLSEEPDRNAVLLSFAARLGPADRGLVEKLAQHLRYGTPPLKALRALSSEIHEKRTNRLARLSSRITPLAILPLVLFSVPCILFVVLHYFSAA